MNIEIVEFWCSKEITYKRLIFLHRLLQVAIIFTIITIVLICSFYFEGLIGGIIFNIILIYLLMDSLRRTEGIKSLIGYINIIKSHKGEL